MDRLRPDIAIGALLRRMDIEVDVTVNLYDIGEPLIISQGYSEKEIANALFYLQSQKVIDLLDGNRLKVTKPL